MWVSRAGPFLFSLFSFLVLAGCREAFTTNVDIVARAGTSELTVARLSEIVAQGKALAPTRDVIDRVARLWVDYSLFAQRSIAGDSLLDSATVMATLWPEAQQRMADHFHDLLTKDGSVDSATVDSAYAVGEYRLLQHVLLRTGATMAPPAREQKRRQAEGIRARLASGGSWAEANRSNEDPAAKAAGGLMGVRTRADVAGSFENAAWGLEPGQISEVVETQEGFHIIRRPRLREQRAAFAGGLEDRVISARDSVFLAELTDRRHVRTRPEVGPLVRQALADQVKAAGSSATLGTFDGGRFTTGDLVRWINAMPAEVQQQVSRATNEQIAVFVRSLMRNHALIVEADSAGVKLTRTDLEEFRELLRRDLALIRTAMGLDDPSIAVAGTKVEDRQRVAALYVDNYLESVANNRVSFVAVPPFLAARLREQSDWEVTPAGVERVLERSTELRAMVDSMRATTPVAPPVDSGGSNAGNQ